MSNNVDDAALAARARFIDLPVASTLADFMFRDGAASITCKDKNVTLSVLWRPWSYRGVSESGRPSHVEIGFPTEVIPELIAFIENEEDCPQHAIYLYVPIGVVASIIRNLGGVDSTRPFRSQAFVPGTREIRNMARICKAVAQDSRLELNTLLSLASAHNGNDIPDLQTRVYAADGRYRCPGMDDLLKEAGYE